MPESLKALRRRVRTVKATKQITRAMEMVSAAKLRRAQNLMLAGKPYATRLQALLSYLARSPLVAQHPLFSPREGNRRTMVVFTADRGFCGGFNSNLIRLVESELKKRPDEQWELYCIGKKGADYFKKRKWPIARAWTTLGGNLDNAVAQEISDDLVKRFLDGRTDKVYLYFPAFVTMAVSRPKMAQFLPLDPEEMAEAGGESVEGESTASLDYILEPNPERVFTSIVPRYLSSRIYITLAEVFTCEHSARMIAMNNATKNCDELSETLTLKLNKARQAQITNELIDIVGGAQAVS